MQDSKVTGKGGNTGSEVVEAALQAQLGSDGKYRFQSHLFTISLLVGKKGIDQAHDYLLEFVEDIVPVEVDRVMANEWIAEEAKKVGVKPIAGKWAGADEVVLNGGRKILEAEGKTFFMKPLADLLLERSFFAFYKQEGRKKPGAEGVKHSIEFRVGFPWEGAKNVIPREKAEALLRLLMFKSLPIESLWANPKLFTPEGGEPRVVYVTNLVLESMGARESISSAEHFQIVPTEHGLELTTEFKPSRWVNAPEHARKAAAERKPKAETEGK